MQKTQGIALEVSVQMLGPLRQVIVYFSKQFDSVTQWWPSCLRTMAATCILILEAEKLAMGQPLPIWTSLKVVMLLETKGNNWLTGGRMIQYQANMSDNPIII